MRKLIRALTALVALGAPLALVAAPAEAAATPGCVTTREYNAVDRGMSVARVHQIFDTRGYVSARDYGVQDRVYKTCGGRHFFLEYVKRQGVWRMTYFGHFF